MSSYTIDIKRIRNKYDINLSIIIEVTPFSIIHEGYKLNTIGQNIVIIETIPIKSQIQPLKVTHPYIIETIDAIYDDSNLYLIYHNYKFYKRVNIKTQKEFNKFFNEFRNLIQFIVEKNLSIEPIKLTDIYIKDTIYVLVHYKQTKNNKNIEYGSPIYSPPELFSNKKIYLQEQLLWNFGIILYEIIKKNTLYNDCKDIKDIIASSKIIHFDKNNEDIFLKLFLANNQLDRISMTDFFNINIEEYNIFEEIEDKKYKNTMNDDMFEIDIS